MWLTKMSTAISLLLAAAVLSMVGTFIPQYLTRLDYIGRYGEWGADTILLLGLDHVYRGWWFLALMAIVLGSVTLCLWRNGRFIVRHMWVPRSVPRKSWFLHAQELSPAEVKHLRHWHTVENCRVAVSGRLNRLGYFLLHIGVVGVAVGGLVTGFVGFRATLNIREGETDNAARIFRGEDVRIHTLPFQVTNVAFTIDAYTSGQPRQYATTLQFVNANKNMSLTKVVSVNTPAAVGPYTFYQSTFGDGGSAVEFEFFPLHTSPAPGADTPLPISVTTPLRPAHVTANVYSTIVRRVELTGRGKLSSAIPHSTAANNFPKANTIPNVAAPHAAAPHAEGGQNDYAAGSREGVPHAEQTYTYTLLDRVPQVVWQGQNLGPGVTLKLERPTEAPVQFQMYKQYPQLIGIPFRQGNGGEGTNVDFIPFPAAFAVKEYGLNEIPRVLRSDPILYSGLQVVYDPGKYIFWPSCLMLLVGIYAMLTRRYTVVWENGAKYYKSPTSV